MNEGKREEIAITVKLEKDGLDYDVKSHWDNIGMLPKKAPVNVHVYCFTGRVASPSSS